MKKMLLTLSLAIVMAPVIAQSGEEVEIIKRMDYQVQAWNRGRIDDFMKSYWQNDSLMFIGRSGITYGYNNTLKNYKKNYNSPEKMGKLTFSDLKLKRLCREYYFVTGKWYLKRTVGDAGGYYTLLFRKINGIWLIVCDHSS